MKFLEHVQTSRLEFLWSKQLVVVLRIDWGLINYGPQDKSIYHSFLYSMRAKNSFHIFKRLSEKSKE